MLTASHQHLHFDASIYIFRKKIIMHIRLFSLLILLLSTSKAFSFVLLPDSNKTDSNNLKQGYWVEKEHFVDLYGDYISKAMGYYLDGKRTGVWQFIPPGSKEVNELITYKNGMRNGLNIKMNMRGFLYKWVNYKNDSLDGLYREYTRDGKLMSEINYKLGQLEGVKKVFYEDGKIQETAQYANNKRNGMTEWFDLEGNVTIQFNYKDNSLEGIQKTFYKSGSPLTETTYKNNMKNGLHIEYYENGMPKESGYYVNDKKEGEWNKYNIDGSMDKVLFKDDQEVKRKQ